MLNFRHFRLLGNPIVKLTIKNYYCTNTTQNKFLNIAQKDGIKNICLNHPKTRNSLSYEMMTNLLNAIVIDQDDPSLRVIVLSANGPVFSAGHNLKELSAQTGIEFHKNVFKKCTELVTSITKCPVPIIAKVDGLAAAAGCQVVASCDIIVCSENSTFSTPGASFGIFCSTPGIAIGRCVPKSTATRMLFTGLPISSDEAFTAGLVSKVVPADKLDSEVIAMCEAIKSKSRRVVKLGKEFYYKQIALGINEAYQLGEEIMTENVNLPEGQEGINSFAEKRKPKWTS